MVDSYNMNEYLERSWCLVYYQILEEPGIAGCNAKPSHRSDIYAWKCTCFFSCVKFSQLVSTVKLF